MQNSIYKKTVTEKCCYSLLRIYRNLLFTHAEAGEDFVDHGVGGFFARQLQQRADGALCADIHGVEGHAALKGGDGLAQ